MPAEEAAFGVRTPIHSRPGAARPSNALAEVCSRLIRVQSHLVRPEPTAARAVESLAVTGVNLPVSILALQTVRRAPPPPLGGLISHPQDVLSPALASHTAIARLALRTIQRAALANGVQHLPLLVTLAVTS